MKSELMSTGMSAIRRFSKSCIVLILGRESRPRKIVRGLACGYRIHVSPAENLGYLLGTYEPQLQKIISEYVTAGDTVYDIGANIGYVSLSLARCVGDGGLVIAFEPVPRNIILFRENIQINRLTNIRLLEFAVSDRCGEAIIRIAENLSMASLVWHQRNHSAIEIAVKTVSIDELVESGDLIYPSFVKIDVEGAEGGVLQGMRHTLAAAKPTLFVECSEAGRETAWFLLRGLGYRCQLAATRQWVNDLESYRHSDFLWLPPDA
jgi:FkbM family methyltransferase